LLDISKKLSNESVTKDFLFFLLKMITETNNNKIATLGLQILDGVVKEEEFKVVIRNHNPISFIVVLLSKFGNDNILTYVTKQYK